MACIALHQGTGIRNLDIPQAPAGAASGRYRVAPSVNSEYVRRFPTIACIAPWNRSQSVSFRWLKR